MTPPHSKSHGVALLTALVLVALVASLASGMLWQQWRTTQVESAERARAQSVWLLSGALDWARLILREDARSGGPDHLGEPWAIPLAEARLGSFLAADSNTENLALDAWLSGRIVDAQSRFNLTNLFVNARLSLDDYRRFERICELAGLPTSVAAGLAQRWQAALQANRVSASASDTDRNTALLPARASQLAWLGLNDDQARALAPWVTVLPVRTTVNINTAPAALLAALVPGLSPAEAQQLAATRVRTPFRNLAEVSTALGEKGASLDWQGLGINTGYFEVMGRLRLEGRVLDETALMERNGLSVRLLWREQRSAFAAPISSTNPP